MKNLLVINVLSKNVYNDCHIAGSINVPLEQIQEYASKLGKETPIVVYCASYNCPASARAWHILNFEGFKNIYAYEGGISEWVQKKYPVEGACSAEYIQKDIGKPEPRGVKSVSAEQLKKWLEER